MAVMARFVLMKPILVTQRIVTGLLLGLQGGQSVALEQAHTQQQTQGHVPTAGPQDAGIRFDRPQFRLHLAQARLIHEVGLVEHQDVAVHHLGTGDRALHRGGAEVLGIDQGDDRIEPQPVAQVAGHEGQRHRQGVSQSGGFHHDQINRLRTVQHPVHSLQQFPVDRAADAAVAELHHLITGGHHELVVNAHLTELVDQHGAAQALLVAEDVIEQGGLARAQEAGENGHGHRGPHQLHRLGHDHQG